MLSLAHSRLLHSFSKKQNSHVINMTSLKQNAKFVYSKYDVIKGMVKLIYTQHDNIH